MLVSHLKRFIFFKTVKTAGTSVEIFLEPHCRDDGGEVTHASPERISAAGIVGMRGADADRSGATYYNHMPARDVRALLEPEIWESYCKVTVVRNPFDKVVSAFCMAQRNWLSSLEEPLTADKCKEAFEKYLFEDRLPNDRRIYSIDLVPCCQIYLRYETLARDLEAACEQLGITFSPAMLGRYKGAYRPRHLALADYYSTEAMQRVVEKFDWEFNYFGYSRTIS